MAVTVSGLYVDNYIDMMDTTQLALNFDLATHKIALHSNSLTPNFSTDVTWSSGSEVFGTGWATGGIVLNVAATGGASTAPSVTESPAGSLMYDMGDISVASTTLSLARCAIIYQDALADQMLVLINFGGDYSTSSGTFGIQWAATGVFAIDLTP